MSAVGTGGEDQESAYKAEGTIDIGCIPNCVFLFNVEKNKIVVERKK